MSQHSNDTSKAFIRTDLKTWGLAKEMGVEPERCGIPCIGEKERIPIISCIGTSRDGKSTLLNILHKLSLGPGVKNGIAPFVSRNGHAMVTNGIDYVHVPNTCMLIDCQGMALKDAKFDHFLTLIVYLISDTMVLNVRQQLDLQVLNNLLAVFSFLSEIPDEHRRKDRPTLVIRIKDFQDMEAYEENPHYLDEYVKLWLKKSGDQYDHIKEAFNLAFRIEIVITEYPCFSDNKKKIININDPAFETTNPSFVEACQKILSCRLLSEQPSILIRDPVKLLKLVADLKKNDHINFRKLDLYHSITSLDLERYVNECVNIRPYNEDNLMDRMDGSREAYDLYNKRQIEIIRLHECTFNVKFKDVSSDLKQEIFGKWFINFNKIVNDARDKNMSLARDRLKPYFDKYNDKYDIGSDHFLGKLVHSIKNIFDDASIILQKQIFLVDDNVQLEMNEIINKEKDEIIRLQQMITNINSQQIKILEKHIAEFNPNVKIYEYLREEMENQIKRHNYKYTMMHTKKIVINKLKNDVQKIFDTHKTTYYLNKNKIITSTNDMKYDIDKHIPTIDETQYWYYKELVFKNHVFMYKINGINMDAISNNNVISCTKNYGITLFDIKLFDDSIQMTYSTYLGLQQIIITLTQKYKFLKVREGQYDKSIYKFIEIYSDDIPKQFKIIIKNHFYDALLNYVCEHQDADNKLIFHE